MTNSVRGFVNNFTTKLNGLINNSTTSIVVNSATGISTELANCDFIALTIDDGTNVEIVHVTSVATNTLTVERGAEGTTAVGFATGTTIECRLTAQSIKQSSGIWQPVKEIVVSGTPTEVKFEGLTAGDYRIDFTGVQCTTGGDSLAVQQGTGGTPTYQTATYYYSGMKVTYSAADAGNRASNAADIVICPGLGNNAAIIGRGFVEIDDVATAGTKKPIKYESYMETGAQFCIGAGSRDVAEAVTAIKFFFVAGDTFTAGRFMLSKRNF